MLTVVRPTEASVIRLLLERTDSQFTYHQVGMTHRDSFPPGFVADRERTLLGYGEATYEIAKEGLRRWAMFPGEMTTLFWKHCPIRVGEQVAVLFRAGPLWSLNPCRIVDVFADESEERKSVRFGFACGTLPGHLECGEEQFAVSWNRVDDSVHYELLAVSRPDHWLTKIGSPHARHVQARFRRLSGAAMKSFVTNCGPGLPLRPATSHRLAVER